MTRLVLNVWFAIIVGLLAALWVINDWRIFIANP